MPNGDKIIHEIESMIVLDEIYIDEIYEKYSKIKLGSVVVDCGATYGSFSIKAKRLHAKKILAIEPDPFNLDILKTNMKINKIRNITIVPVAISNKDEIKEGVFWGNRVEKVITKKLSTIIRENNLNHIDFLKMDIEGAELEALKSIRNIKVNYISLEYHGNDKKDSCKQILENMNFKVKVTELKNTDRGYIYAKPNDSY